MPDVETRRILQHAKEELKRDLTLVLENKKGNRNTVITVNDGKNDLIVKAGLDVETDYLALSILNEIGFPSPKVLSYSSYHSTGINCGVVIMSKLAGIQVRSLSPERRSQAVSNLIDELEKLRMCKSVGGAGSIKIVNNVESLSWKEYLEKVIDEAEKDLKISNPVTSAILVDWETISSTIEFVRPDIASLPSDLELNLLHNDLNLTNCLATAEQFVGIVDWSDAIYGDWLYDLARLRMNLEQSRDEYSLEAYRLKVRINPEETKRERLYYLCRLIEYLGIYRKYGDDHWFNRNQQLLLEAIAS